MKLASYVALFVSLGPYLFAAQPATRQVLTLEIAKQVAAAASAEATANKWTVVIAILDEGGNLMYLERADDTQIGSIQVAQEKAKSAVSFKRPTKVFEEAVAGGRTAILKLPGAMPVEGGLPLMLNGRVAGAIGVSGVTSQQDGQIAKAGADALAKIVAK
ncbi:MAG TPA: heme-binding protein [Bryobacteraceae bacterium]|nr:heme-binding protein [Bryobacteraceae bacterium]